MFNGKDFAMQQSQPVAHYHTNEYRSAVVIWITKAIPENKAREKIEIMWHRSCNTCQWKRIPLPPDWIPDSFHKASSWTSGLLPSCHMWTYLHRFKSFYKHNLYTASPFKTCSLHILQTCPHLQTVRQQFWPEDTEVGTKLWGKLPNYSRQRTS